eukprot:2955642-Amphidinium_carterae.1
MVPLLAVAAAKSGCATEGWQQTSAKVTENSGYRHTVYRQHAAHAARQNRLYLQLVGHMCSEVCQIRVTSTVRFGTGSVMWHQHMRL